jgi:hypothetical protein
VRPTRARERPVPHIARAQPTHARANRMIAPDGVPAAAAAR